MDFLHMGSWPDIQYEAQIPSWEVDLKSTQEAVGYLHYIHTTIASVGIADLWWFENAWPLGNGAVRSCSLVGGGG